MNKKDKQTSLMLCQEFWHELESSIYKGIIKDVNLVDDNIIFQLDNKSEAINLSKYNQPLTKKYIHEFVRGF